MESKKYWKGLEEWQGDPVFKAIHQHEFAEELPVEGNGFVPGQGQSRRDFLKLMGFGLSAATLAASCRIPVKKAIPYLIKPEEVIPGEALWYASTFLDGNDFCPVLVKVRDGRPIKLEPCQSQLIADQSPHSFLFGGTSARAQASVLSLYDLTRPQAPTVEGKQVRRENMADLDAEILSRFQQVKSAMGAIRLLTPSLLSPSTRSLVNDFLSAYPTARHIIYDPISYSAIAQAHGKVFGRPVIPGLHFEQADVIVSVGADFLGTWLSPVEFARQYVENRKVIGQQTKLSKHYQFECRLSLTGANADERAVVRASQENLVVVALFQLLNGGAAPSFNPRADELIARAAADLKQHPGRSLLVSGSNDPAVQELVAAINWQLGNYGSTLHMDHHLWVHQFSEHSIDDLLEEMQSGSVAALVVYGANPVYDYRRGADFGEAMKKVPLTLSLNDRSDETTALCTYHIPDHHYLESWNDCTPHNGICTSCQPVIWPLFQTRQAQETLMKLAGLQGDFYSYMQRYWRAHFFPKQNQFTTFEQFWNQAVKEGAFEWQVSPETLRPNLQGVEQARQTITQRSRSGEGLELCLYEKVGAGNGRYANNPWLMEMPDPISKVVWDNYVCVSPKTAAQLKLTMNTAEHWSDVVEVRVGDQSLELPVVVLPGQEDNTVAVALGYGRSRAGRAGNGVGRNAFPLLGSLHGHIQYYQPQVAVRKVNRRHELAITQTHFSFEGRDVIRELSLSEYLKAVNNTAQLHPKLQDKEQLRKFWSETLYPDHSKPAIRWAMSIDLNSCIGCGACTVSCQAENNVPVVGKTEVRRMHEMTWLRIDRYFQLASADGYVTKESEYDRVTDFQQVRVTFQPMLCQHCTNAPCENVCPVNATNHSAEGLNQMAYNRCIGTRYCANNCPYKVRRFNWLDYTAADVFPWNEPWKIPTLNIEDLQMHDPVTRMVLNPDVTVRTRGVMEKCSFCVQRLQEAKLTAKKEGRPLRDGDAKTACQTACPTDAIQFGNLREAGAKVRTDHDDIRSYFVLGELNTQPGVAYMVKVRNVAPETAASVHVPQAHHDTLETDLNLYPSIHQ